jgi:ribonuclease PH
MVALYVALGKLVDTGAIKSNPCTTMVAAVSVGLVGNELVLDLDYEADSSADVDMNVVMTSGGGLVEVQGTAERAPMTREQMNGLLDLASEGIGTILDIQNKVLGIG